MAGSRAVGEDPIRSAAEVDPAWLTAVLHADGVGRGSRIVALEACSIGTGQVGDNVRYELAWSDELPDLPVSVVGKFPSSSEVSRATAVSVGTYVREIGFYRDLRPSVRIRTPHAHHIGWEPASHDFVLVLEDIRPANTGDQLAGGSRCDAELAIDEAVALHGPSWGRAGELARLDWLGFPDDERLRMMGALLEWALPAFCERYRARLDADDLAVGDRVVERYRRLRELTADWADRHGGWCVTHGDYRLDNMLFGTGPTAPPLAVVDWQTVAIGIGPSDVAYFCGAGLAPSERAAHEGGLVRRYAAGLRRAGVELADDAAWEGYVLGAADGYLMAVIASQIVERTDRGDEMFAVMAERHAAQIRDVGLLDRLAH